MIEITIKGFGCVGSTTVARDIQRMVEAQGHLAVIFDEVPPTVAKRKKLVKELGRRDVLIIVNPIPERGGY